ncbi:MAG: UDP-4-amino-4,6-dideoxy-N-acetyl-beta-L-altrosamine transaminase [Candidatus Peregrinibacteria bacterium]
MSTLALHGGTPVRQTLLPYARQSVSDEDITSVTEILRSDWLTTGPTVAAFENAFATFTQSKEAIAVSSGTAALHTALYGIGIQPGDEVIVPPMTFAATANAAAFMGATPVFADCEEDTLLIDSKKVEACITKKTKAIIAVDYAGQPCDYEQLQSLADKHHIALVADACHALGGSFHDRPVGSLADCSIFSFHPVKPITTGEGGMITTNRADVAERMRRFRNHCIATDHRERQEKNSWRYEVTDMGYNYRLTDIQCALGLSQMKKIHTWTTRRQELAKRYSCAFSTIKGFTPLTMRPHRVHAFHLYVVQLDLNHLSADRDEIYQALRAENIGVNVHYIPVHLHPFYQKRFGTKAGLCPVVEHAFERIISLPLFASMTDGDAEDVIAALEKTLSYYYTRP